MWVSTGLENPGGFLLKVISVYIILNLQRLCYFMYFGRHFDDCIITFRIMKVLPYNEMNYT